MSILSALACGLSSRPVVSTSASPTQIVLNPEPSPLKSESPGPAYLEFAKRRTYIQARRIEERKEGLERRRTFPGADRNDRFGRISGLLGAARTTLRRRHTTELRLSTNTKLQASSMPDQYETLSVDILGKLKEREDSTGLKWIPHSFASDVLNRQDITPASSIILSRCSDWKEKPERVARFVSEKAPQLFTMLLYASQMPLLKQFYEHELDDDHFPVKVLKSEFEYVHIESRRGKSRGKSPIQINLLFNDAERLFLEQQHRFFAPTLTWEDFNHDPLPDKCALPFLTKLDEEHELGRSNFSIVYRSTVESKYVAPNDLALQGITVDDSAEVKEVDVAVKVLIESGVTKSNQKLLAKYEWDTLNMLRQEDLGHECLIKAITFCRWGDTFVFVFPRARCDLKQFWETSQPEARDKEYMAWFFAKLRCLAEAIKKLHHGAATALGPTGPGSQLDKIGSVGRACRHGDLKPENVLCFDSPKTTKPKDRKIGHDSYKDTKREDHKSLRFVISDVGFAITHEVETALRGMTTRPSGGTATYAAPETDKKIRLPEATSRRYDIWSLGCLYLEFLIWLLHGIAGLRSFHEELNDFHGKSVPTFYHVTDEIDPRSSSRKAIPTAKVCPVVTNWIQKLKKDPRCAQPDQSTVPNAVARLITLIETGLLVPKVTTARLGDGSLPVPTGGSGPSTATTRRLRPNDDNAAFASSAISHSGPEPPVRIALEREATLRADIERRATAVTERYGTRNPDERAWAEELCTEMGMIIEDATSGEIEWINPETIPGEVLQPLMENSKLPTPTPARVPIGEREQQYIYTRMSQPDDRSQYIPDDDIIQKLQQDLDRPTQSREPSRLCQRCGGLSARLERLNFDDTLTGLQRKAPGCALCRLLSSALKDQRPSPSPDETLHFFRVGSSLKVNDERLQSVASLYTEPTSDTEEVPKLDIQLGFPRLEDPECPRHAAVLREWLRECDQTHDCRPFQKESFLPTRLLDVGNPESKRCRLVCDTTELQQDAKYLALSHRWGEHDDPALRGKTLCTYAKNKRRLADGVDDSEFPPMYQDAIMTARRLDVRYLWIDSLCIIQRDDTDENDVEGTQDWAREVDRMRDVFTSAYATIAASRADPPAKRFLERRPTRDCVTTRAGDYLYYWCEVIDDFAKDAEDSALNKRGWVFQERALSRRTIYFTEKQSYWECGRGVRCETAVKSASTKPLLFGDADFPFARVAPPAVRGRQIEAWQRIYTRYTRLDLTRPTDRPAAIKGLEARLLTALESQGAHGVIERFLRRGLLWMRDGDPCGRVDFSSAPAGTVVPPTWSWMRYKGRIQYMEVEDGKWTEWAKDVMSPWAGTSRATVGAERGGGDGNDRTSAPQELRVLVRDLGVLGPRDRVFLDEPDGSAASDSAVGGNAGKYKCVVVGSSGGPPEPGGGSQHAWEYYVLIVSPVGRRGREQEAETKNAEGEEDKVDGVYTRAGVGHLASRNIVWDRPAVAGRLR